MNKQISLGQYRAIDLSIWGMVLIVTQVLTLLAANVWFRDQLYIVSPVAAVVALVMMRWGPWAAIHAVLGGGLLTLASVGNGMHGLIYCVGNL